MKNKCLVFILMFFYLLILNCNIVLAETCCDDRVNISSNTMVDVTPDIAYIEFIVNGYGNTALEATNKAANKLFIIKKVLLNSGINGDELKTISYNLNRKYTSDGHENGYVSSNSIQVRLIDISKIGETIDKLSSTDIDSITGVYYSISDREIYQNQLLDKAIKNARQQASIVANASGRSLGKLLSATISNFNDIVRIRSEKMSVNEIATDINSNKITLSINIETSFALK